MAKFDKYDIFMKMLEIMQADSDITDHSKTPNSKIANVFDTKGGDVSIKQISIKEVKVDTGDNFENVNQSVIGTREANVAGTIEIITTTFQQARQAVDSNQDIDNHLKDEIRKHLDVLETELKKGELDAGVLQKSMGWLKRNAGWLVQAVPTLAQVVIEALKKIFGQA